MEQTLQKITAVLRDCPFILGVVLGGSHATGTATAQSDIDIGIYYDAAALDVNMLNRAAKQLDDSERENLVCREGEWGKWVNGGGWLTVDGRAVDLLLRDMQRVEECILQTGCGRVTSHYQTGHPHAYLNVMYRGELASCRVLYAKDAAFLSWKQEAERYPAPLREALISFFHFEAEFSCMLAAKSAASGDIYTVCGHLFRSISALNQVLFALNRTYCLNEKKAVWRAGSLPLSPARYRARVEQILTLSPTKCSASVALLEGLCKETELLVDSQSV